MNRYHSWEIDKNFNPIENIDKIYTGNSIDNIYKLITYNNNIIYVKHKPLILENGNRVIVRFLNKKIRCGNK